MNIGMFKLTTELIVVQELDGDWPARSWRKSQLGALTRVSQFSCCGMAGALVEATH